MMTMERELLENGAPGPAALSAALDEFALGAARRKRLQGYYERRHPIDGRVRAPALPNNRLSHDLPGYIVSVAAGYLVGSPVQYALDGGEIAPLTDALRATCADSVDAELAVDASVYGRAVELCYSGVDAKPCVAQVSPNDAFVVYDDTVEHAPLFGVLLSPLRGEGRRVIGERVAVYTAQERLSFERRGNGAPALVGRERHFFGAVPVVEYWNNARETGDFEGVLPLIDAYDALQSDRMNDKQQFTDAILVVYGAMLDGGEDGAMSRIREERALQMPGEDARVEWLTKQLSESDTEVLKNALKADIHKLSFVPDLTDESFAGNSSGVAMKYKLFGLEQLVKIKERWFREGLRQRLRLFCRFLAVRGCAPIDPDAVQMTFTRGLPVNELETAQTAATLRGIVPDEELVRLLPFVGK